MKFILTSPVEAVQYQEGLGLEDGFLFKIWNKEGKRATVLKPEGTPETDAESLQALADSYRAEGFSYDKVPFVVTRSGVQNDINVGDYIITDADGLKRIESKAHFEATHTPFVESAPSGPEITPGSPSQPEPWILPGKLDEEQPNEDGLVPAKPEDITTANDVHAVNHPEDEAQPVDVIGGSAIPEGTPIKEPVSSQPEASAPIAVDSTSPEKTVAKVAPKVTSKAPTKGKTTKGK